MKTKLFTTLSLWCDVSKKKTDYKFNMRAKNVVVVVVVVNTLLVIDKQ